MNAAFLCMCLLLCGGIDAQVSFNKILYPGNGIEAGDNVIEVTDGYIVCGGGFLSAFDGWGGIVIIKTDFNGNELWRKDHGKIGYVWNNGNPGSMVASLQGGFAVAGYFIDTNSTDRNAALFKFDDDGNFEWMKVFGGQRDDFFSVCKQLSNGDYLAIGYTENFGDVDGSYYVVKTDSLGNLKWQKTYGGSDIEEGVALEITLDSNYLFGGGTKSFGSGSYNNYLIKTDTSGSVIWTSFPNVSDNSCGSGAIKRTSDEGFIVGSCSDSLQNANFPVTYIQKVTDTGEVVWRHYFEARLGDSGTTQGMTQIYRQIIIIGDDEIVVVGEERSAMDTSYEYGWIIKLDKNGNKIWERVYTYAPKKGISISAVAITSDNGFICTGTGFEQGFSNSSCWLLKLDSLGCLSSTDCGIFTGINEPIFNTIANIQIVPNPAQEKAIIAIKATDLPRNQVVIQLFDMTGKMVKSSQTILNAYGYGEYLLSRNNLNAGTYLVSINSIHGIIGKGKIVFQ